MPPRNESTHVRKGRFLWMESDAQTRYLCDLKKRIHAGHYFSDQILSKIVEDIAPVFEDQLREEISL